ncbi:peptidase M20 [Sphingobium sp. 22B]|uniref:M20 aminoacylase family protein n=1 Tax=unclassified Sphingobium TaxID=2611147 RepID=UPI000781955F|nr:MULTISPECIES: M20 aminoacylase family protein [unclassified Sphingobium]KXU31522.1 peptidase M20 [Sphingobium sp. AM]KYC31187.1 peptidase M20 [Sphingobium sp. 22B]OAP31190.1 peptidase M20 [Sphingobium sp. 20006FA]
MHIIEQIAEKQPDLTGWRRTLHAEPEIAFQEHRTSDFVAAKLTEFGIDVHRGLGGTGVVGTLRRGAGGVVGLRADMDALRVTEANDFGHASRVQGQMHACGHDGHVTMLLGAARHLAEHGRFRGTVHFIFQPAEEGEAGGRRMIEEGLFDLFPVDRVFGMHNWPGMPAGHFGVRPGPMMASSDSWEMIVEGAGGHAAMPDTCTDPVIVSAQIVLALQTIVSRNLHPVDSGVVSVTQVHAGDALNVIPGDVVLRGTARSFLPATRDLIERRMGEIARGVAQAGNCRVQFRYDRRYPPTVNDASQARFAADVAAALVGEERVDRNPVPTMGAEDFAFMLEAKPGAYLFIGNGPSDGGRVLHSPHYDFNDAILPVGASYWVRLVETALPA